MTDCSDAQALQEYPVIRLYTYAMSPYAAKVHCFLLYKQIPFECVYVNPLRLKAELPMGTQVPVLTVDRVSRTDSTPIGLWLDELFPEHPLLLPKNEKERNALLAIDTWVSNRLIPGWFRAYPGEGFDSWINGWTLGKVMHRTAQGGLPPIFRWMWPLILKQVGFIRRLIAMTDTELPLQIAKRRLYEEFLTHLGQGPFLGQRPVPSLPDFSVYPLFTIYRAVGLRGTEDIGEWPMVLAWLERMRPYLVGEPPLVPPAIQIKTD